MKNLLTIPILPVIIWYETNFGKTMYVDLIVLVHMLLVMFTQGGAIIFHWLIMRGWKLYDGHKRII